jgi:hypothetical protein
VTASAVDPTTALVVIDLQKGIMALPTVPNPPADVLSRTIALADAFRSRYRSPLGCGATVRARIPSVARSAVSGITGKIARSRHTGSMSDQS